MPTIKEIKKIGKSRNLVFAKNKLQLPIFMTMRDIMMVEI